MGLWQDYYLSEKERLNKLGKSLSKECLFIDKCRDHFLDALQGRFFWDDVFNCCRNIKGKRSDFFKVLDLRRKINDHFEQTEDY